MTAAEYFSHCTSYIECVVLEPNSGVLGHAALIINWINWTAVRRMQ